MIRYNKKPMLNSLPKKRLFIKVHNLLIKSDFYFGPLHDSFILYNGKLKYRPVPVASD